MIMKGLLTSFFWWRCECHILASMQNSLNAIKAIKKISIQQILKRQEIWKTKKYDIFKKSSHNKIIICGLFFSWPILKLPYLKLVRHFMIECCVLPKSHINSKPNWKATAKAHWAKFGKECILLEMYVFGD